MSSLKMTFSLTSLIFLIALGLVFVPTSVMAHDDASSATTTPREHSHPLRENLADQTDADGETPGTAVTAHYSHPTVTSVKLKQVSGVTRDNMAIIKADDNATADVAENGLTLIVTFSEKVNTADGSGLTVTAADLLEDGDLIRRVRNANGVTDTGTVTLGTVTRMGAGGVAFEVPLTFATLPTGTAELASLTFYVRVNAGAVFGLAMSGGGGDDIPGGSNYNTDFYEFKLVQELGAPPTPDTGVEGKITGTPSFENPFPITITFAKADVVLMESDIKVTGGAALVERSLYDATPDGVTDMTVYKMTVEPHPNAALNPDFDHITVTLMTTATVKPAAADMGGVLMLRKKDGTLNSITAPTASNNAKFVVTLTFAEGLPSGINVIAADLKLTPAGAMVGNIANNLARDMWEVEITPVMAMATTVELSDAGKMKFDTGSGYAMQTVPATTGTVTTTDMLASNGYLVVVPPMHNARALPGNLVGKTKTETDMPDLVEFFRTGGTIDVVVTGKANHNVIITEIMLAKDLSRQGETGMDRPEAVQWIELYNNTNDPINISAIDLQFRPESPAAAMPENTTDRISNTVSGEGWAVTAFESALSGETGLNASGTRVVTANFNSIRRVHKDNKQLQNEGTVIQNGWLRGSWALTANTRVYRAGRIGTPGAVNRPIVYEPPSFEAPDMSVTFNEIANMSDDDNEWIELKGPADTNMRKYKISIVTGYNKDTNTGTETTIFQFPDNDDIKIPSTGILLLTDKSPVENKLEADLEDGVEKPVRYRIKTLAPLPDDGAFLLLLRNKDGKILDVAGHKAGLDDNDPYTRMWPLAANVGAAKPGHISAKNALKGGNVYRRARNIQGYLSNKDNGDEPAFEGAGFTGIGYDRNVSPGNKEHHGTPGYDNGVQIGAGMEATDNVVISEVMYGDGSGNLPQWIEIQNRSHTNGVDLHNWKLYVVNHGMNADGSAFEGKVVDGIFLRNMKIPPRQTALVVSKAGQNRTQLPAHRVLNLKRKANDPLLSSKGFYLFLVANAHEGDLAKRQAGDDAGNLPAPKETATGDNIKLFNDPISTLRAFQGMDPAWELPAGINANDYRVSIVRKGSPKILNPDGTAKGHWVSSEADKRSYNLSTSYGRQTDVGTPGNTPGAPLPVSLSKFRPERLESGEIVVRWITESELNNAGFNILRSETRDGEFSKINTSLIEGQGTTSERTTYEWKDKSAKPNVVYYYQIQDISLDGKVTTLRQSRLKGDVSPAGKLTTTWGELKALQ